MNTLALTDGRDAPGDAVLTSLAPNWGTGSLREALTDNSILHRRAERLQHRYGIPVDAGVMMACTAVTAAAGPCYALVGPTGMIVHPSLHFLLVSTTPCPFQFAALEAFDVLTGKSRWTAGQFRADLKASVAELNKSINECLSRASGLEGEARTRRARIVREHGEDFEMRHPQSFAAEIANQRQLLHQAKEETAKAGRLQGTAAYFNSPGIVMEGLPPAGWLDPGECTSDGALFNLDPGGCTWGMLLGERPVLRRKVAQRLIAGLTGSPCRQKGAFSSIWHLSSLSVIHPVTFARLTQDDILRESGLTPMLVPIETRIEKVEPATTGDGAGEASFNALLALLFERRVYDSARVRWHLSPEAEGTCLRFLADLAQASGACSREEAGLLNSLPMVALKLLVLLRLGTDGGAARTDAMDDREMHTAIAVALRVACGSARALGQAGGDRCWAGHEDRVVFEMVTKLRIKGPLCQRDLFRTYHDQRTERLLPVLERGLAIGIIQSQDGLLAATGGLARGG